MGTSELRKEWLRQQKKIRQLEKAFGGHDNLYNLLEKVSKIRAMGIDIDRDLDKEITRLKGGLS